MEKILLIIPAYNEEENILRVVTDVKEFIEKYKDQYKLSYIVINDGSKDSTLIICRDNNIKCISLEKNLGIGGAVQTGYMYAKKMNFDIAVQYDGDGQHNLEYLYDLVEPIISREADFTIGSRFLDEKSYFKSTALRRLGIKILSTISKIFSNSNIKDVTSGFRAANKEIIELFSKNYPSDYPEPESLVYLSKKGFTLKEVPVEMFKRSAGVSSIKAINSVYYMLKVSIAIIITSMQIKGDESQWQ